MTLPSAPQTVKTVTLPPPFDCEALVYIDTVKAWIPRPRNLAPGKKPPLLYQLWRANKGRLITWPGGKDPYGGPRGWIVTLHQPTKEALDLLARNKRPLNRVDVALDMPIEAARRIVHHGVQKWRGKRMGQQHKNTTYWATTPATARNLVHYDDKPSKVTGEQCGHLEFRFNTLRATQAAGLDEPATVLDVDIAALVAHQIRLLHINPDKWSRTEERVARKAKRRTRRYRNQRIAQVIQDQQEAQRRRLQRICQTEDYTPRFSDLSNVPVQVLYDNLPTYRKCLEPL